MGRAFDILMFTLDRVRNVLLVLAMIVLLKTAWVIFLPAVSGP